MDGRDATLANEDNARTDPKLLQGVARIAGLLLFGREYPLFEKQQRECWVREARRGYLKIDFIESTTIIAAAELTGEHVGRVIKGVENSYYMAHQPENSAFSFIPIVKAGIFENVVYYIETVGLPDIVPPGLVLDSLRFCRFLVANSRMAKAKDGLAKYWESLAIGEDPEGLLEFEPSYRDLLWSLSEEQRKSFIREVGEELKTDSLGAK
jgi:hypothetical protein